MSATKAFAEELADLVADRLRHGTVKKDLYTVEEAATYLSCSQEQVRRFMNSRQIPTVKIDSRPRFRVRDLEKFVESSKE